LGNDRRFRVYDTFRLEEDKPGPANVDWYDLDKRHYDVIVIGDISAKRFAGGDPSVFKKIKAMVTDKGTGLLMMGGQETFLGSDWQHPFAKELVDLLPVTLDKPGQVERRVRMMPTNAGLAYLLRLDE